MKKLFLLCPERHALPAGPGPNRKGSRYLGANVGNLSYSKTKSGYGGSTFSASLYPSAGVFVADNFMLCAGLQLGYSRTSFGNTMQDYFVRTISYGLAPFGRYYFAGSGAHRVFGQLSISAGRQSTRQSYDYYTSGPQSYSNSYFAAGAGVGYNYFLTPGAALEVLASYDRNRSGSYNSGSGTFNVLAGFAVFLPSKRGATAPAE